MLLHLIDTRSWQGIRDFLFKDDPSSQLACRRKLWLLWLLHWLAQVCNTPGCTTNIVVIKGGFQKKKSRIRETKHLSTGADSSTDTKKILLKVVKSETTSFHYFSPRIPKI